MNSAAVWMLTAVACLGGCAGGRAFEAAEAEYRAAETAFYIAAASPNEKAFEAWEKARAASETAFKAVLAVAAPDSYETLTAAETAFIEAEETLIGAAPNEWRAYLKAKKAAARDPWQTERKAVIPNEFDAYKAADADYHTAEAAFKTADASLKAAAPEAYAEYQEAQSKGFNGERAQQAHDALWRAAPIEKTAWDETARAMFHAHEKKMKAAADALKAAERAFKAAEDALKAAAPEQYDAKKAAEADLKTASRQAWKAAERTLKAQAPEIWEQVAKAEHFYERSAAMREYLKSAPAEWKAWLNAMRDAWDAQETADKAVNDAIEALR